MYWRSGLRGVLQGDIIKPLVFVLICVPGALLQSTPSNPVILAPFSALEGSSVNLTCISTGGNPLPTVTWYRGNQIVDQSYRTNSFGSTTQTINDYVFNVYRNDSSVTYRCDVDNVNLGSPLMKTAILTVYVQPGPPVITGSSVLTAGSTYTHKCRTSAGGNPIPTLNWMLGNQSISNLAISRNVINLNDNTYIVEKNITWVPVASDNGKNLSCALSHNETLGSTTQLIDSFIITVQVLPNITTSITSYSRTVGDSVTLACSVVAASPSVTSVYWTKLSNSVTTNVTIDGSKFQGSTTSVPSLTINTLQTTDAGVYTCNAVNAAGTGSGLGILLSITGSAPSVSIPSSSYPVNYNANTTLICNVTATPSATGINWYKVVNGVDTLLSISGNSRLSGGTTSQPSLTVTFAVFNDEGSYKCEASNLVGATRSVATFLDVIGSSPTVTIPISSYSAVYGNSVTINCTVSASPAATLVSWQQIVNSQSTTISPTANPTKYSGSTTSTPSLTINNLVTADSGYYVCSATNPAGTTVSGQTLLTVTGTTPTVSANPTSYSENYGTNVTLQCSVSGNPVVTAVYWSKTTNGVTTNITTNTAQSSSKYSGVTVSNPSLQITSLTLSDSGSYVCFGINSVGSSQTSSVTLNVIGDAPTVSVPQNFYSALIGTNVQMPCSISANPATTSVYWLFNPTGSGNNVQISQTGGRYTVSSIANNPTLSITNVTFSDTGTYTCTAVNAVGTGTDGADFNVTGSSPSVSIAQQSYSVLTGNTITIPCTITASPSISNRYWIFDPSGSGNNVQITTTSGRYTLGANTNSPSLTISNAVAGDAGTYMCFATNLVGTTSDSATLTITGGSASVGASTASGGLTTGEIAAIVLAVLLILLLIIVICICCCTHGVCGVICGKKKDPKGRVEPVKEKEVYKETIRHIEIPRFEEKPKVSPLPPIATDMSRYEKERDREGRQESFRSYPYGIYKRREHSAVSRRDVDVNVKRENDYDIVRYETVPPAGTYYGDTIISVHDDVRASPRPHRLPALTTYTYEEAERRRKHRRKKKKHRRRHDDEEVIVEKVRTASPVRVIEEVAPVRVIEEPAETVIVERVRTASPVRYVEEPAQDVIIESVRRSPSTRRKRSDEEEMIVRTSSRSPSRRRRHEERYVTTERVVNGDVYRDGGDLRAINGEVYRDSGEYSLSRHGSGRFTRESRSSRRKEYAGSDDVEVEEGSAYYVERR